MAGRGGASVLTLVSTIVMGLLTLTFFVLTIVFFSNYTDTRAQLERAQADANDVLRAEERNRDDIRTLTEEAKRARLSLVGYLVNSQGEIMQRVTGSRRDSLGALQRRLEAIPGADTASMIAILQSQQSVIADLESRLAAAEAAQANLAAQVTTEAERTATLQRAHASALAAIGGQLDQYKAEVDRFRVQSDQFKAQVAGQLDSRQNEWNENRARLETQLSELNEQLLISQGIVVQLRGERGADRLNPDDEAALVDAQILSTTADRTAFINIGRNQRVQLGMTFSIFADARALRPTADGRTPQPKATAEVINVGDSTATVRITRETRGNPVVRGDVLVNPVFDPRKTYTFVVFGNFEVNNDGIPTALERTEIERQIQSWGGAVVPELTGNVDFLILGERPVLPPRPGTGAPLEVVLEFNRRQREVQRYDDLFRAAGDTGIPVLNANRLKTLLGQ